MASFLDFYFEDETSKKKPEEVELVNVGFENIFFFSWVWSVCCTCMNEGRKLFNELLRGKIKASPEINIPDEGTIYDYCYNLQTNEWTEWTAPYMSYNIDTRIHFAEIVVPTIDYARMKWLQKFLFSNKKHVLCPGPVGTGKSVNANDL